MPQERNAQFDVADVIENINGLASQRPVAGRIIAAADAEDTDARKLSLILASDVALSGRVMRLANSAYYGMRGRVSSLHLAVTVVGFTTVRTIATVSMTDLDDDSRLPENFWTIGSTLAVAAERLAPKLGGLRPADALCLGVLAELGTALLYHHDRQAYAPLLVSEPTFVGRRRAETARYGMSAVQLTAVALETWGFPQALVVPMQRINDRASAAGGLLRAAYEVVSRLIVDGHQPVAIGPLTRHHVRDEDLGDILHDVRNEADDLRRLILSD